MTGLLRYRYSIFIASMTSILMEKFSRRPSSREYRLPSQIQHPWFTLLSRSIALRALCSMRILAGTVIGGRIYKN
jgi:hypothetical protein